MDTKLYEQFTETDPANKDAVTHFLKQVNGENVIQLKDGEEAPEGFVKLTPAEMAIYDAMQRAANSKAKGEPVIGAKPRRERRRKPKEQTTARKKVVDRGKEKKKKQIAKKSRKGNRK